MIKEGTVIENEIRKMITEVENEYEIEISTKQKILLSIKGPITNILDAMYGAMNLFMLDQHFKKADEDIAELLEIDVGDEIDYREVIVHKGGRPLVYALSYIPKSLCNEEILEDLLEEKLTTGKIIDKHSIETSRIISRIDIEKPTPTHRELFKNDGPTLTREYTMKHGEKIIIWTKESYPLDYFKD